jgi:hypothetical protein
MRLYLCGPMRGYPLFNFPAFDAAAASLRAVGYEVFSPADHDRSVYGELTPENAEQVGFDLRGALGADTAWICAYADGVAFLPGSHRSKGALAEMALADALGIESKPVGSWIVRANLQGAFNA